MNTNQKTAIIVGILYIIGTVTAVLSVVVTAPVLSAFSQHDPESLLKAAPNETQIILGALLVLTMGFALAMVPVMMFPILKKFNEVLALGYLVFRGALETFTYIALAISFLLMINLSREFIAAGAPAASYFQPMSSLLSGAYDWMNALSQIVFALGALMFYYLLYQTKLIPRWISGWGLIGAVLFLGAGLLSMFGLISDADTMHSLLVLPLALQEMVMALWLIVKGFNPATSAPQSAPAEMIQYQLAHNKA